jgi:hypothetical protein
MADDKNKSPQSRDPPPIRASIKARDLPVILLFLLGAVFCFSMFRADLNRTMDRFAEPIGTITYKRQAAQRRFTDHILWVRLSKGAPVYQGDYIRTAELSQATMHFRDGMDIDLAENTLIQLRIEGGKNVIELSGGNLSAAVSGGPVRILLLGENRVEIGPGAAVSASADPSGFFSMQVLEGEVTANGKTFGPGDGFSTGAAAVRALSPRPDTWILAEDGTASVRFSWSAPNHSGPVVFELAPNRRFRLSTKSVVSGAESLSVTLSPGVYWWRVYPEQSAGQNPPAEQSPSAGQSPSAEQSPPIPPEGTVARKITVVPPASPTLISPAAGLHFYPKTEIRFFWTNGALPPEIEDTGDYILELSGSSAFETPLMSFNVEGTGSGSLVYSRLEEGTWYWRVRQLFPGMELAAAPRFFTIAAVLPAAGPGPAAAPLPKPETAPERQSETTASAAVSDSPAVRNSAPDTRPVSPPPLPPPSGMNPPDRFTVGPELIRRSRRLVFSWNGVADADAYVFTLFEEDAGDSAEIPGSGGTRNPGAVLLRTETAEPFYVLEDLGLLGRASGGPEGSGGTRGTFVWRVEAVARNGADRRGTPGESRFTLDVPAPGNPRVRETGTLYGL